MKREEELEQMRLEQIRLEAERKEKKKQKEKERKERLKAEGKLLTPKQKLEQARAQAMLESLRAQGVELPEVGAKKPRPGTRIRPNKKNQQAANQAQSTEKDQDNELPESDKTEQEAAKDAAVDQTAPVEVEEKVKDSWDASSSEDESNETEEVTTTADKQQEPAAKSNSPEESDTDKSESEEESESSDDEDEHEDTRTDAEIKREKAIQRIQVGHQVKIFLSSKCSLE